jgi:hypothetical protein
VSLSHETILELMSLADGELEGAEKERVEQLVAASDEARRVVESMRRAEVGNWVAKAMDDRAVAGGADGIADAVMAAVDKERVRGNVASLGNARARRLTRMQVTATVGAGLLALAAAVALYVHSGSEIPDQRAPVASVGVPPVDFQVPSATVAQREVAATGGVEVNEIDAPSRGVSVFEIPATAAALAAPSGPSSVVVWVDDDMGTK